MVLHLDHASESLGILIKTQSMGPYPQKFWCGWDLRIHISYNSLDDADAAGPETMLKDSMTYGLLILLRVKAKILIMA